jgi:hypothetical protein
MLAHRVLFDSASTLLTGPACTEAARRANVGGKAALLIIVDIDGMAKNIEVLCGVEGGLDEEAIRRMQQ